MPSAGFAGGNSATNPVGSVISVTTAGIDAIQITGTSANPIRNVYLGGFSVVFASSLSSTGHGINCTPPSDPNHSGYYLQGLTGSVFSNIFVSGNGTGHFAFNFINQVYNIYENLSCQGGLGLKFEQNDFSNNNYGNSVFRNIILGTTSNSNNNPPVQFVGKVANTVNLCVFDRFQVGFEAISPATQAGCPAILMKNCTWMVFNGLDIEYATGGGAVFFPMQMSNCAIIQINNVNAGAAGSNIDLVGGSYNIVFVSPNDITLTNSDSSTLSGILVVGGSLYSIPSTGLQSIRWIGAPVQAISSVSSSASPWKYVNPNAYDVTAIVFGGTTTQVIVQRGGTQKTISVTQGEFYLASGDTIWIYYSGSAPTLVIIPH